MTAAIGGWLGLVAAVGLVLALSAAPCARGTLLGDRVLPYLRDLDFDPRTGARWSPQQSSGGRPPTPTRPSVKALGAAADRVVRRLAERLDVALGGPTSVRRRLDLIGSGTVEAFRVEQLVWAAAGLAAPLGWGLVRTAAGSTVPPGAVAAVSVLGAVTGLMLRDKFLSRSCHAVRERITGQLPAVAELVALAVAAGEGPAMAIDRVCGRANGDLAAQLRRAMADVRAGSSLPRALHDLGTRCDLPALRRFTDAVVIAIERGTPLAAVLRAQAGDARDAARRAVVERAARQEIAMLAPVVFLVLPVSVLFALFPGFYGLNLTAP